MDVDLLTFIDKKLDQILKDFGGPGSGYSREEGHKGRPGLVGGSSKNENYSVGKSLAVYHGTSIESAKKIKNEGLKTRKASIGKRPPSVYFMNDFQSTRDYVQESYLEEGEGYAIIEFEIPPGAQVIEDEEEGDSYRIETDVPANFIRSITYYDSNDKRINLEEKSNRIGYCAIVFPLESDKELGGPGSGFKGHRGRPGLVGGSSGVGTAAYNYAYASAYIDQNKRLREQSTKSNSFTRELDKQIRDNARIPDKTIYRGTSIHSVGGINAKVGDTFIDEGYGSFTENKKIANNWSTVTLVIEKENAVKMLRISDVARAPAGYGGEAEWLMPRGTTYKIIDIEPARVGYSQTYFIEVVSSREKNLSSELTIENDNIDMDSLLNFVFLVHREMIENPDITEEEAEENVLEKLSYDNPSELGGPGSGYSKEEGHKGRPGQVGGSQPSGTSAVTKGLPANRYAEYASMFNEMSETGTAKSKENKKWIRNHQDDYNNDRQFKAVADYATLYSQGSYDEMKAIAYYKMTGEWPKGVHNWEDSVVPDWVDKDLGYVSNPMGTYKNYFEGQNVEGDLGISTGDASMVVEKTIANAPELGYPVYRGVTGYTNRISTLKPGIDPNDINIWDKYDYHYEKWPPIPQVGETMDFVGATSFSADGDLARAFSEGSAPGQHGKLGSGAWATFVYEVEGAKGIEISALSPWHQSEVLTSGRYEVTSVDIDPSGSWISSSRRGHSSRGVPHYHVKLKQVGSWNID